MSRVPPRPTRLALALAALTGALAPVHLSAQAAAASATGEIRYQLFTFDEEASGGLKSLGLTTFRFAGSAPLGSDMFSLGVSGAWGSGRMERAGGLEMDVSGFTDTQLSLTFSPNEFVDLSGIVLLATGEGTLTADESLVSGALAADLFPFSIATWGSGGGFGANATVAYPLGSVGAGLSVGYIAGREFEPLTRQQFTYRPGDLLRLVAAVDGTVGEAGKASLRLTYYRYGEDELDGRNLFRSGDRFQVLGSLAYPVGSGSSGLLYAGVTHRQRGVPLEDPLTVGPFPSQNLILLGGGIRTAVGGAVLRPDAELRVLTRSDGTGEGFDVGLGGRVELDAGGMMLAPSAHVHFGQLDVVTDESAGLLGFELGLAARFGGDR